MFVNHLMLSNLNCSIAMEDSNRVELVFGDEEIVAAQKRKPPVISSLGGSSFLSFFGDTPSFSTATF